MPMAATQPHRWTAADVQALPDNPHERYECVDGVLLVSPSPRMAHQRMLLDLAIRLAPYVETEAVGTLLTTPYDVVLDEYTLLQPDILVLPAVDGRLPRTQEDARTPILAIEILTSSTTRNDRMIKRPRLQRAGIETWLVDIEQRCLERWLADARVAEVLTDELHWTPTGARTPFVADLCHLFARANGEE
jgi:Uma2 family endonuclease